MAVLTPADLLHPGDRAGTEARLWQLLEEVCDPEVPVLSVVDLGVVREIKVSGDGVTITITPTYSGCPAVEVIATSIRLKFLEEGFSPVRVRTQLSPAWTTDWLSEAGKDKLLAYGIAPPVSAAGDSNALFGRDPEVSCPRCGSRQTRMISQFGSTACKAHYQCQDCLEPFDYFKCHK